MCRAGARSGSDAVLVRTVIGEGVRPPAGGGRARRVGTSGSVNAINQAYRAWVAVRGDGAVAVSYTHLGKSSSAIHGLLTSLGWLPWLDATARLVDLEGAWLAPGGIVRKTARDAWPKALPVTTRIHAVRRGTGELWRLTPRFVDGTVPVSYTHLDVYKRQTPMHPPCCRTPGSAVRLARQRIETCSTHPHTVHR